MRSAYNGQHVSSKALLKHRVQKTFSDFGHIFLAFALAFLLWPASHIAFADPDETDPVANDTQQEAATDAGDTSEEPAPAPSEGEDEGGTTEAPADEPAADDTGEEATDPDTPAEGTDEGPAADEPSATDEEPAADDPETEPSADDPDAEDSAADDPEADDPAADAVIKKAPKKAEAKKDVGSASVSVNMPDEYNDNDVTAHVAVTGLEDSDEVTVSADADCEGITTTGSDRSWSVKYTAGANEEKEYDGAITVSVNGEEESFGAGSRVVVDKHAPEVKSFKFDTDATDYEGDVAYINFNDEETVTLTAVVEDRFLDKSASKIAVDGLSVSKDTDWSDNGNGTVTGKVTFAASDFANGDALKKASIKLRVVDLVDQSATGYPSDGKQAYDENTKFTSEQGLISQDALAFSFKPNDGVNQAELNGKPAFNGGLSYVVEADSEAAFELDGAKTTVESSPAIEGAGSGSSYTGTASAEGTYVPAVNVVTKHGAKKTIDGESFVVVLSKPELEVALNTDTAEKIGSTYVYKSASDVTLSLKVANALSIESADKVKLAINGTAVEIPAENWNTSGSTWTATVDSTLLPELGNVGNESNVAVLSATNIFEDEIADAQSEAFAVDEKAPTIEPLHFDNLLRSVVEEGKARAIFGNVGVVKIVVSDADLESDATKVGDYITVTKNGAAVENIEWTVEEADGIVTATGYVSYIPGIADEGTEGDWGITVEAKDLVGLSSTASYPNDAEVEGVDQELSDLFTIDTKPVEIAPKDGFKLTGDTVHSDKYACDVYVGADSIEGELAIIDRDLDLEASSITIKKTNLMTGKAESKDLEWPKADDTYKYSFTQSFAAGFKYEVAINVDDYAKKGSNPASPVIQVFAVDNSTPKVKIAMDPKADAKADGLDYFGTANGDGTLTAKVTVTSAFLTDVTEPTLNIANGDAVTESGWVLNEEGNEYSQTITFPENEADASYDITGTATDELARSKSFAYGEADDNQSTVDSAGEALSGSGFVADFTAPEVSLELEGADVAGTEGKVDYYGENLKAKLVVSDASLVQGTLKADVEAAMKGAEGVEGSYADGAYTATATYKQNKANETYAVSLTVKDKAGHETEYKYANNVEGVTPQTASTKAVGAQSTKADGSKVETGSTKFAIDTAIPTLSVSFDPEPVGADGTTDYYDSGNVVATITSTDVNFDADAASIKAHGGEVTKEWAQSGAKWEAEVTYDENKAGKSYKLDISVQDKLYTVAGSKYANHKQKYSYSDGYEYEVEAHGHEAGDTTSESNDGVSEFVVDATAPTVKVAVDQPKAASRGGSDYYGNAKGDKLTFTITVEDNNFDPNKANSTISPTDLGTVKRSWKQDSDNPAKWTAVVTFSENTDTTPSDLKAQLVDKVYTYAKNKGDVKDSHLTKYDYGKENTEAAGATVDGSNFYLDLTAPNLTAKESTSYSTKYGKNSEPWLFYNKGGAGLRLTVSDAIGIAKSEAEAPFTLSGKNTNVGTSAVKKLALIEPSSTGDRDGKITQMHDHALVTLTDYVGNWRQWNISPNGKVLLVKEGRAGSSSNAPVGIAGNLMVHPTAMILDTVAPAINWTSAPAADSYHNTTQSATLSITERNFDLLQRFEGGRLIYTIYKEAGNAGRALTTTERTAADISGSGDSWSRTEQFAEDGHYRMTAQFEDISGNKSNLAEVKEFTIDKTNPVINSITWDNNDVRNGKYYKAARTATITITEHNWDESLVKFDTNGSIGNWSTNGDVHVCHVSFTADGDYHLSIDVADKAGNTAQQKEEDFTVDLTAPTITFTDVEESFAYNDPVIAPVVVYEDEKNFDASKMESTLTGNKHGLRDDAGYGYTPDSSGNSGTHSYNIPDEVEGDDIYTIDAHLEDLAGNEAQNSITFSVNRYGSNFIVLEEKKYEDGILGAAPEVVVQEINVNGSEAKDQSVAVSHGLATDNLERLNRGDADSDGFYVRTNADAAGWVQNEYHIGKGNFAQHENDQIVRDEDNEVVFDDGNYHVVVHSTDRATNLNNSANYYDPDLHNSNNAEVEFTLDTHPPIINALNVSDGAFYADGSKELTFTVTDNVGLKSVEVEVDGDTMTPEANDSGVYSVQVPEGFVLTPRNVTVRAYDLANNMGVGTADGFHVFGIWQIIAAVAALGGAGGGAYYVRRRNQQQPAQQAVAAE